MPGAASARALYLELAARGVCVRTGAVPGSMPCEEAGELLGRVRANRAGLREVLAERGDADLEAVRSEARGGGGMTGNEAERKERKMGAEAKIEHKDVRVILDPEKAAEAPPDVKQEGKLIDWAAALHENAMLIAAAGVLASEGSLEKAASVLWWAGFPVPAGHFPEGHEGDGYSPNDEEALRLWVEGEAGRIERVVGTAGFRLAATGRLMEETDLSGVIAP